MKKFVGICPDGNNAVFQYPWGRMSHLKKNRVIRQPVAQDLWLQKSWVEFGVSGLTILPLSVKHTGWTLHICSLSLLTSTKLDNLSYTTIVLYIQIVLMVVIVLQHMCIATTKPNAMYPWKQSGLVHDISASGNACMVFFREQSHFMLFEYFDPYS
jgi:hypothetical protein